MTDSYHHKSCPSCFGMRLKICGAADSSYCGVCDRWLEAPITYIPRPSSHPTNCKDWSCRPDPVCAGCKHTMKDHGRAITLSKLEILSKEERTSILHKFTAGPHKCIQCDCPKWTTTEDEGCQPL